MSAPFRDGADRTPGVHRLGESTQSALRADRGRGPAHGGGNRARDLVAGNLLTALHVALRGRDCDVHGSNRKVVSPAGMVTYPDVFVRCGPLDDEAIECADPVVVFEALSPSTRSEDLVRKRWAYQAIPTLAHLVYVDAGRVEVEVATRAPDRRWWSVFLHSTEDELPLDALGIRLRLTEMYAGTRASG
jgi:Uma2 family endonuclease